MGGEKDEPRIPVGAMAGQPLSSAADAPVVVLDIPFDTGIERTIPLNWKLSRKQKEWYQKAWEQIFFRKGGDSTKDIGELTEVMDLYFQAK